MAITMTTTTRSHTRTLWCAAALAVMAACGGHKAAATTPSGEGEGEGGETAGEDTGDTGMIPPEVLDGITETLDRKRTIVARCLSDAVLAGTAPKNARGKIALEFVVDTSGHAKNVKIVKSTVKSEAVDQCVAGKVSEMSFPEPPKDLDWSYTYAFDSN
ncbi:MAG: AgmX/PglI C-terminal domain-containing protein [Deltaproteobacteria bacterium]|nr:AgmX/PglI C-terminal domain-containing protein [Deltaproteobacteria bacterium]